MRCLICHAILPADAAFCPACGAAVGAATGATQRLVPPTPASLRNGVCPQCHAQTVYTDNAIPEYIKRRGDGANVLLIASGLLPTSAALTHYVCASCGYAEMYLSNAKDCQQIAQRWMYVAPQQL